jgi:hypothetical protein
VPSESHMNNVKFREQAALPTAQRSALSPMLVEYSLLWPILITNLIAGSHSWKHYTTLRSGPRHVFKCCKVVHSDTMSGGRTLGLRQESRWWRKSLNRDTVPLTGGGEYPRAPGPVQLQGLPGLPGLLRQLPALQPLSLLWRQQKVDNSPRRSPVLWKLKGLSDEFDMGRCGIVNISRVKPLVYLIC